MPSLNVLASQLPRLQMDMAEETMGIVLQKMDSILNNRFEVRERIAKRDVLDELHRFAILKHPVIRNRMYSSLLSGQMPPSAFQTFFNEYHHASCREFMRVVLRRALDAHQDKNWRAYIKALILEESRPRAHFTILKEFIESCGFRIEEPVVAQRYIDSLVKGYTADLPFAWGYALAIEVEGGYQIDVIEQSCRSLFSKQLAETVWFDIHLDSTGEEEHANFTVESIEKILSDEQDYQRLREGFCQACDDTYDFMESIYNHVDNQ